MAFPSAIGCFVIGESPIGSGGPCLPQGLDSGEKFCRVIPSYVYWQYRDDDNIQAFVDAYNEMAQQFLRWLCDLHLPIYTKDPIRGALLDWVGEGVYGFPRPVLGRGQLRTVGPYNTWRFNTLRFNTHEITGNLVTEQVTDDVYRRALTWHFYKGDGQTFTVSWLKRRVMRFLTGVDGTDPGVDQTYRVSVSFGYCCQVNITIKRFFSKVRRGARYNTFRFNTTKFNAIELTVLIAGLPFDVADQFKAAVEQGILELPFQYTYVVRVE